MVKNIRKPSLKKVHIPKLIKCKNKKHGCSMKNKLYTCLKRYTYKKNKNKRDVIKLTNSKKNKSRKLKTPIIQVVDYFDCSHFK
jgi:hypothetical protein